MKNGVEWLRLGNAHVRDNCSLSDAAKDLERCQVFHLAEFQYFNSSVARILFRSLFIFASFGNSFSIPPITRAIIGSDPPGNRMQTCLRGALSRLISGI